VSSKLELDLESESAVTILAESVAQLDGGLEVVPLEDNFADKDFPDRDLPKVLPVEVLNKVDSSGSCLRHLEAT
jgi:hypothetical protein